MKCVVQCKVDSLRRGENSSEKQVGQWHGVDSGTGVWTMQNGMDLAPLPSSCHAPVLTPGSLSLALARPSSERYAGSVPRLL